jgi:hypothetical protein
MQGESGIAYLAYRWFRNLTRPNLIGFEPGAEQSECYGENFEKQRAPDGAAGLLAGVCPVLRSVTCLNAHPIAPFMLNNPHLEEDPSRTVLRMRSVPTPDNMRKGSYRVGKNQGITGSGTQMCPKYWTDETHILG